MYTAIIMIGIAVIVIQFQMASLKAKIEDLQAENEVLKSLFKNDISQFSISLSGLMRSIEALEIKVERIENEEIHGFHDDISFLKTWVKNIGNIATSTRDKLDSIRG